MKTKNILIATLTLSFAFVSLNATAQKKHNHSQNNNNGGNYQNGGKYNDNSYNRNHYHNSSTVTYTPGYSYVRGQQSCTPRNQRACGPNQVRVLPHNAKSMIIDNRHYYKSGTTFYMFDRGFYTIVQPPINAKFHQLPPNTCSIWRQGRHFYTFNGVMLEPFINRKGLVKYRVVGYV